MNLLFSFQFLLIFRKAAAGELEEDSGLLALYRNVEEIDVDAEGVKGAKNFFQAKVSFFINFYLTQNALSSVKQAARDVYVIMGIPC